MAEKQGSDDIKLETASFSSQNIDPEEERKLVRKLDGRILVILSLFISLPVYLDRSNLGNARLLGLPADTLHGDPTGKQFDWVNSVFFFAYILCQVPATITSKLFPPRVWLACMAFGNAQFKPQFMATAFDFGGLMTGRVFLGIFEAGFGPVIPLYFSFFYTKQEMGVRMAYWFGFAAVAGGRFRRLIAFGVQHAKAAIHDWRILFLIEGIPAILMGLVTILFLPNRPESTTFFNERERAIALDRMNRGTSGDTGAKVEKAHIFMALRDWRVVLYRGWIYFGLNCALASISAFLPTIIATFGFISPVFSLILLFLVAAILLLSFSWVSDRLQSRGVFMSVACVISGIGYVLLLAVPSSVHVRYFAVFCIVSGTYTTIGLIIAWFAHNLGSETKRATGIPIFMAIGQCGSVLGSHIFPLTEGPRYILTSSHQVSCALSFLAAVLSLVLSFSYRMDNARRDKLYGKPNARGRVDTTELADKVCSKNRLILQCYQLFTGP
ncbi:MFS general substrate transporter [Mycena galopus ATCC 62051]|nr:MFS general substrate transporter [Mycena galopus ATCC 62051]